MIGARRILPAVLVVLALIGIFRLRIDVDILNLLPSESPVAQGLSEYQENFLQAGELIIVLRARDAELAFNAATSIVAEARSETSLVDRVFWQPPANDSLDDAAKFVSYLWLNSAPNKVSQLQERLSGTNMSALLERTRDQIASSFNPVDLFLLPRDPLNLSAISADSPESASAPDRFFSSEDGRTRLVYLYAAVPLENYAQCHEWVATMREMVRGSIPAEVEFLFTGRPVFVDEISMGMRNDMETAVPGTLFLIGVLFYLLHREWRSLALLLATLFAVMIWAALAGSALIGQLNVISVGFASILLGLAEDFGIVLHQELKNHPGADGRTIRRLAGPSIFWSAVTTASAFALLNFSALPGLRHLGTLVALGIVIGAWAMLYIFLPLLIRFRTVQASGERLAAAHSSTPGDGRWMRVATVVLLLAAAGLLAARSPQFDASPDVLRPRKSEASEALQIVQATIGATADPYWLVVKGESEGEVRRKLELLERYLSNNATNAGITDYTLPLVVWPDPAAQQANLQVLRGIAAESERISAAVLLNGFAPEALEFSTTVFGEWERFVLSDANWPSGRIADWVLPKFVARGETNLIALGVVTPGAEFRRDLVIPNELAGDVLLSGWGLLGKDVLRQVQRETPMIAGLVGIAVIAALWFTFRNGRAVLLSLGVLGFSGMLLLAVMGLFGWRWNLLNLTALPLLLGMGIDYSIHMQTTLARFGGNGAAAFQSVGRALLLAGSTTIIGFAFLGMSSNAGMASLGRVCALGLGILLVTSVFLLPAWVRRGNS